jgi:hypothetical protein
VTYSNCTPQGDSLTLHPLLSYGLCPALSRAQPRRITTCVRAGLRPRRSARKSMNRVVRVRRAEARALMLGGDRHAWCTASAFASAPQLLPSLAATCQPLRMRAELLERRRLVAVQPAQGPQTSFEICVYTAQMSWHVCSFGGRTVAERLGCAAKVEPSALFIVHAEPPRAGAVASVLPIV